MTSPEDASCVHSAGADALGLNFARKSPRFVDWEQARKVADVVRGKLELVGVFVDASEEEIVSTAEAVGLDAVQLHGEESPEFLEAVSRRLPAYKALRIGSREDVRQAEEYGQRRLLTDAKVAGAMGGTGHTFDWSLICALTPVRDLIVAGGLRPENVEECVRAVRPYGIDTASGVEVVPGVKDVDKVNEFVRAARAADSVSNES